MQTAFLDLLAQLWRRPLAHLLAPTPAPSVAVHALVDSTWAAQEACAQGYTALKIKVGRRQLSDELGTLCAIRSAVGPAVALRLDANGAWPRSVAEQALKLFAAVTPAWVEQPVAAEDLAGLCALRALNIAPIAVDESVTDSASLHAVLAAGAADGVVIKPAFVGGALAAYDLGRRVLEAGLSLCITHALESSVGRMAALQVASALGVTEPCGLGGALQQDPAPAPMVRDGRLALPTGFGLGLDAASWRGPHVP
jgi:L-alanine-DL-glutamate epimerase-like enolase superfamily enzyme